MGAQALSVDLTVNKIKGILGFSNLTIIMLTKWKTGNEPNMTGNHELNNVR